MSPLVFTLALAGVALISGLLMVERIKKESRIEAWFWAVLFVAFSVIAGVFFWRLV